MKMMRNLVQLFIAVAFVAESRSLECSTGIGIDMQNVFQRNLFKNQTCSSVGQQKCYAGEMKFVMFTAETALTYAGCVGAQVSDSMQCEAILDPDTALNVDLLFPALQSSINDFSNTLAASASHDLALLITNNTGPYKINVTEILTKFGYPVNPTLVPMLDNLPNVILSFLYPGQFSTALPQFVQAVSEADTYNKTIGDQITTFLTNNYIAHDKMLDPLIYNLPTALGILFYPNKEMFYTNIEPVFNALEKLRLNDSIGVNFVISEMVFAYYGKLYDNTQMQQITQQFCPPTTGTGTLTYDIHERICNLLELDYKAIYTQLSKLYGAANINDLQTLTNLFAYPLSVYFPSLTQVQREALTAAMAKSLNPATSSPQHFDTVYTALVPASGQTLYNELTRLYPYIEMSSLGGFFKVFMMSVEMSELPTLESTMKSSYTSFAEILKKIEAGSLNLTNAVIEFQSQYQGSFAQIETALQLNPGEMKILVNSVVKALAQTNFSDPESAFQLPFEIVNGMVGILTDEARAELNNTIMAILTFQSTDVVFGHLNNFYRIMLPDIPKDFMAKLETLMVSSNIPNTSSLLYGVYSTMFNFYVVQNDTNVVAFFDFILPKLGNIIASIGNIFSPNFEQMKTTINAEYPDVANSQIAQTVLDALPDIYTPLLQGNTTQMMTAINNLIHQISPNNPLVNSLISSFINVLQLAGGDLENLSIVPMINFAFQIPYMISTDPEYVKALDTSIKLQTIQYDVIKNMILAFSNPSAYDLGNNLNTYFTSYEAILGLDSETITKYTKPFTEVITSLTRIDYSGNYFSEFFTLWKDIASNYEVAFPESKYPPAFVALMGATITLEYQTRPLEMVENFIPVVDHFASAFGIYSSNISAALHQVFPQLAPFYGIYSQLDVDERNSVLLQIANVTIMLFADSTTFPGNMEQLMKDFLANIDVKEEIVKLLQTSSCKSLVCDTNNCNKEGSLDNVDAYTVAIVDTEPPVTTEATRSTTLGQKQTTTSASKLLTYSVTSIMGLTMVAFAL